jgi:hypothetical protein
VQAVQLPLLNAAPQRHPFPCSIRSQSADQSRQPQHQPIPGSGLSRAALGSQQQQLLLQQLWPLAELLQSQLLLLLQLWLPTGFMWTLPLLH